MVLIAGGILVAGCGSDDGGAGATATQEVFHMTIIVQSDALANGEPIPRRFTGDGENVSPPLRWSGAPAETRGYALICDDPDAPRDQPFVHWVLYALPPAVTSLPEGIEPGARPAAPAGAVQGKNDFGKTGYGGPAPPRGHGVHHYHFKVYALDQLFHDLEPGLGKAGLLEAIGGHVLAQGELVGTYERR